MVWDLFLLRKRLAKYKAGFDGKQFFPTAIIGGTVDTIEDTGDDNRSSRTTTADEDKSLAGHDGAVNGGIFARGADPNFLITYGADNRALRYKLDALYGQLNEHDAHQHDMRLKGYSVEYTGNENTAPTESLLSCCLDNPKDLREPQRFVFTA